MSLRARHHRRFAVLVVVAHVALVIAWVTRARLTVAVDPATPHTRALQLVEAAVPPPPPPSPVAAARPPLDRLPPATLGAIPVVTATAGVANEAAPRADPPSPPSPPASPASSPAPLRLALTRDQLQGFAHPAPHPANALRRIVKLHGERVAQAIEDAIGGSDEVVVDTSPDGVYRVHYGRGCLVLTPTAMSRIDPIGHANDPMLVSACTK